MIQMSARNFTREVESIQTCGNREDLLYRIEGSTNVNAVSPNRLRINSLE
jgi:hypothetical protein